MADLPPAKTLDKRIGATKRLVPLLLPEDAAALVAARRSDTDGLAHKSQQAYAAPQAERNEVRFVLPGSRRVALEISEFRGHCHPDPF